MEFPAVLGVFLTQGTLCNTPPCPVTSKRGEPYDLEAIGRKTKGVSRAQIVWLHCASLCFVNFSAYLGGGQTCNN